MLWFRKGPFKRAGLTGVSNVEKNYTVQVVDRFVVAYSSEDRRYEMSVEPGLDLILYPDSIKLVDRGGSKSEIDPAKRAEISENIQDALKAMNIKFTAYSGV